MRKPALFSSINELMVWSIHCGPGDYWRIGVVVTFLGHFCKLVPTSKVNGTTSHLTEFGYRLPELYPPTPMS